MDGGPATAHPVASAGCLGESFVAAARRTVRRGYPTGAAVAFPRFAFGVFAKGVKGSRGDATRFCANANTRGGDDGIPLAQEVDSAERGIE